MTFEKVKTIISSYLEIDESEITLKSNLVDDLGVGSYDLVDMAMMVEDEFGVELPVEMLESIQTIEDVVSYIDNI